MKDRTGSDQFETSAVADQQMKLVGYFDSLLDTFGLLGPVDKPIKAGIYEMQHVRNVVVHRGGRANRRFVCGPGRSSIVEMAILGRHRAF